MALSPQTPVRPVALALLPLLLLLAGAEAYPNYYVCTPGSAGLGLPFCNSSLPTAERVADLLGRMSLPQKCAQTDDKMGAIAQLNWQGHNFNTESLHGLGAICLTINQTTRCPSVFAAPPLLGATFNMSVPHDVGVTVSDEIRAFNNFNGHRDYQSRPIGVSAWHTNLNLYRDPRWGRNLEVPTEDPFLGGAYGTAYTRGLQEGDDPNYVKAIGALKHYTIYSVEAGRGSTYFDIATHDMEDSYLPAFKASVVDGGSLGYMCSYAALTNAELIPNSGVAAFPHSEPCCASEFLAKRVMQDMYNFTGYVQSDCGAVNNLDGGEKWVATPQEAAAKALDAGMMNSNCGGGLVDHICDAINQKLVSEDVLDARITRSLTLLMRAGIFDPIENQPYTRIPFEAINSPAAQARNLNAARQGLVLLHNPRNVLPLTKGSRIALIGPHARTRKELAGNYFEDIGLGTCAGPDCIPTLEEAINARNRGVNATVVEACADRACAKADIASAVAAVQGADAVLLAVGLDGTLEGEAHDRMDIRFPGQQLALIQAVAAAAQQANNIPVAVLLFNGGMLALEELSSGGAALLECWYPGATGGTAVAEAVFGDTNMFGKLPVTAYSYAFTQASPFTNMNMTDNVGRTYKYLKNDSLAVYPFAHGLSYTNFSIQTIGGQGAEKMAVAARSRTPPALQPLAPVHIKVTNTGSRAGDEVVFLFHNATAALRSRHARRVAAARASASASASVSGRGTAAQAPQPDPEARRQLIAFERVSLAAGASQTVTFNLTLDRLSVVDARGTRHVPAGLHGLVVSRGHGAELSLEVAVEVDGRDTGRVVVSRLLDDVRAAEEL